MAGRRLTDGESAARKREADRLYYQANRERRKARQRAYYRANRDAVLAAQAADRKANPEKWRARDRKYHAAYVARDSERAREVRRRADERYANRHPERKRGRTKAWLAKNQERVAQTTRAWHAKNPHKKREYRRKNAGKAHPARRMPAEHEATLLEWFGGKCAYCLIADASGMDHVVPFSCGGDDSLDNLVPACGPCNSSKGNATLLGLLSLPHRKVTQRMVSRG